MHPPPSPMFAVSTPNAQTLTPSTKQWKDEKFPSTAAAWIEITSSVEAGAAALTQSQSSVAGNVDGGQPPVVGDEPGAATALLKGAAMDVEKVAGELPGAAEQLSVEPAGRRKPQEDAVALPAPAGAEKAHTDGEAAPVWLPDAIEHAKAVGSFAAAEKADWIHRSLPRVLAIVQLPPLPGQETGPHVPRSADARGA